MNWLRRWLGAGRRLEPAVAAAIERHAALPSPDRRAPLSGLRLVVADVETSGLDVSRDHLISIGAVAVRDGLIRFGDAFTVVLRQQAPSGRDNILLHGIDGTAQLGGQQPARALAAFLDYAGGSPLVGFNAGFDRIMIERAMRGALGYRPRWTWLDLAQIAPALLTEHAAASGLDDWLRAYGIDNAARHDALADACATAYLLLVVLARARARGLASCAELAALERAQRWLSRR
jgi:DNA polymerase-3 subunit epsilon